MKGTCCWPVFGFFTVILSMLTFLDGGYGIVASPVERQLEKFATRVGQKEFISVFKEPATVNGQKSRTFVLLSKLFLLPSNNRGEANNGEGGVNDVLPGGPLKFRRGYIPTATPSQVNDKIFFPKEEDATTRKTASSYLYNKKPLSASDFFSDRKLYVVTGDGRLSKFGESPEGLLNPLLTDENLKNSSDELGWYTLLSVPPRLKKASEGCPPGHRKDPHHNLCRPMFNLNRTPPPPTTPASIQTVTTDSTFSFQ